MNRKAKFNIREAFFKTFVSMAKFRSLCEAHSDVIKRTNVKTTTTRLMSEKERGNFTSISPKVDIEYP